MWLFVSNHLLINDDRYRRHLTDIFYCKHCEGRRDDCLHAIKDCLIAVQVWKELINDQFTDIFFFYFYWHVDQLEIEDQCELLQYSELECDISYDGLSIMEDKEWSCFRIYGPHYPSLQLPDYQYGIGVSRCLASTSSELDQWPTQIPLGGLESPTLGLV